MPLREAPFTPDEETALLCKVAEVMMGAWEKAEGPVNVSYVATFVDMAKALVDSGLVNMID